MHIWVDADACPVIVHIEQLAKQKNIPVTLLSDTNHILNSDYSKIIVVGAGADAVDFELINRCQAGDLVITQDYGVAAMALGKSARAIHPSGRVYTDDNIGGLLMDRHLAQKARRSSENITVKDRKNGRLQMILRFALRWVGYWTKWCYKKRRTTVLLFYPII